MFAVSRYDLGVSGGDTVCLSPRSFHPQLLPARSSPRAVGSVCTRMYPDVQIRTIARARAHAHARTLLYWMFMSIKSKLDISQIFLLFRIKLIKCPLSVLFRPFYHLFCNICSSFVISSHTFGCCVCI